MITYKANAAGTLLAAHVGECRIGYIELRKHGRWHWQLSLVMPGGGHAFGKEDDEQSAKQQTEIMFQYWLTSAGLERTKEKVR